MNFNDSLNSSLGEDILSVNRPNYAESLRAARNAFRKATEATDAKMTETERERYNRRLAECGLVNGADMLTDDKHKRYNPFDPDNIEAEWRRNHRNKNAGIDGPTTSVYAEIKDQIKSAATTAKDPVAEAEPLPERKVTTGDIPVEFAEPGTQVKKDNPDV